MRDVSVRKGRVPAEIFNIGGPAAAVLAVIGAGAALSSVLPTPSLWLTAAAYLAPAGLAFAAYWWMAQKL